MRLIDADALIDEIKTRLWNWDWESVNGITAITVLNQTITDIRNMPTIDAVPVVRCKDCKHWGMHKSLNVPWCFKMHIDKSEDGYCDSGERSGE